MSEVEAVNEDAVEAVEGEEGAKSNGAIGAKYREKYGKEGHCGDDLAELFKAYCVNDDGKGVSTDRIKAAAEANGIEWKYDHLNKGMQRMTIGNMLRSRIKKGVDVTLGDDTIEGIAQESEVSE